MASIQVIYMAFFGRPADPEGLAFWEEQTQGGADLSVMLNALAGTEEYQARFDGMSDAEIITSVYQSLFNRDPDAEGLDFFVQALAEGTLTLASIAVGILDGAQGDDLVAVQNKETAANQFTASLDTPEKIAAYVGENAAQQAREFIAKVSSDPQTIPSQEDTQNAVNELPGVTPDEGQTPGDGPGAGGGGGGARPAAATLEDEVLTLTQNGTYTLTELGNGALQLTVPGARPFTIPQHLVETIEELVILRPNGVLPIPGVFLHEREMSFSGPGTVNITGVTFDQATPTSGFEANVELEGVIPNISANFLVNGSVADAIKAAWDIWDDQYVKARTEDSEAGYYVDEINTAMAELGIKYIQFLEGGGTPFSHIIAKASSTREQSLHDNLLGNVNKVSLEGRNLPGDVETALLDQIPEEYEERPVFSGDDADIGGAAHNAVRTFDFNKGWDRPDYISFALNGTVDPLAQNESQMFYGTGNPITDWVIIQHEGAGVELALKIKETGGSAFTTLLDAEGLIYVDVPDVAAAGDIFWNFDFSFTAGLNGQDLDNIQFRLFADIDPSTETEFMELPIELLSTASPTGFQGSQSYRFNYLNSEVDGDPSTPENDPWTPSAGDQLAIRLEAYTDENVFLVGQTIYANFI